jgi:hypothetical protein
MLGSALPLALYVVWQAVVLGSMPDHGESCCRLLHTIMILILASLYGSTGNELAF